MGSIATSTQGTVTKALPMPTVPEEVTPAWLTLVLGHEVASYEMVSQKLIATTAKLCLRLHWADEEGARKLGLPHNVCLKGGFVPAQMKALPNNIVLKMYTTEVMWYLEVAPLLQAPTEVPRCWWAGADDTNAIIIMDDLGANGYEFGDGAKEYSVAWAGNALNQMAGIHKTTWGAKATDYKWLDPHSYPSAILGLMNMWDDLILSPERPPLPEHYKNKDRVTSMLKKHWYNVDPKTRVLMHGDTHAGNTYRMPGTDEPRFLDMQCVMIGSALWDVAYCLSSALSVADRRAHEMELLDHYLECLARIGGPRLTRDEVMVEFRRGFLFGWAWLITPYPWQSEERVRAMVTRHVAAMEDHGSMELAENMPLFETEGEKVAETKVPITTKVEEIPVAA